MYCGEVEYRQEEYFGCGAKMIRIPEVCRKKFGSGKRRSKNVYKKAEIGGPGNIGASKSAGVPRVKLGTAD